MKEFNKRERYLILRAFENQMSRCISSGDYPEQARDKKLCNKIVDWIYGCKGDITSDEGVGE